MHRAEQTCFSTLLNSLRVTVSIVCLSIPPPTFHDDHISRDIMESAK